MGKACLTHRLQLPVRLSHRCSRYLAGGRLWNLHADYPHLQMRLRSSLNASLDAPEPQAVPVPVERDPDSFDFLLLPFDARENVYRHLLLSKTEIALGPIRQRSRWQPLVPDDNDMWPEKAEREEKERVSRLIRKTFQIVLTCKTIYAEALRLFFRENRFAFNCSHGRQTALTTITGRSLAHLTDLYIGIFDMSMIEIEGSASLWIALLRSGINLQNVTLGFGNFYSTEFIRAAIRTAHNFATSRRPVGGRLSLQYRINSTCHRIWELDRAKRYRAQKTQQALQLHSSCDMKIEGAMTLDSHRVLQTYVKNDWSFMMVGPDAGTDLQLDDIVVMEWVKK